MSQMPKEGRFEYGKMDRQTGAQWVHVTPEMARAHPQGKVNIPIIVIGLIFAATGIWKVWGYLEFGYLSLLLGGALQLLTALTLLIRAPIALFFAGGQLLLSLFFTVTGGAMKTLSVSGPADSLFTLGFLIFSALSLFYLFEGDRPNLIYRHRYRSFAKRTEN
ncbi:hypothetical protein [Marivivens niveibacter]|nr:hypothetical protein [Marivivens niveibacter]